MNNKKIYNIIPGKQIEDNSIIDSIFSLLDSVSFSEWIELNEDIYNEVFFKMYEEFYVMYLDPAGIIKRLYISFLACSVSLHIIDIVKGLILQFVQNRLIMLLYVTMMDRFSYYYKIKCNYI